MDFGCQLLADEKLCLFNFYLPSSASLASTKLEVAPVWVVVHNISPQHYSFEGLNTIGSRICECLYTKKSKLDPVPRSIV